MARRVLNAASCIVNPARSHRLEPLTVPVQPRHRRRDGNREPTKGETSSDGDEQEGGDWDQDRAGDENQRGEENEAYYSCGDCKAGEQEQNAAGDDDGEEPHEFVRWVSGEGSGLCFLGWTHFTVGHRRGGGRSVKCNLSRAFLRTPRVSAVQLVLWISAIITY